MIRLQHDIWKAVCMQDVRYRDVDHYTYKFSSDMSCTQQQRLIV